MPAAVEEHAEHTKQEADPLPGQKSASFNSMADKLNKLMAPFVEAAKPAAIVEAPPKPSEEPKTEPQVPPPKPPDDKKVIAPIEDKQPDEELPESIRKSPKASEEFKKIRTAAQQFKAESEKHAAKVKSLEDELGKLKSAPVKPAPLPPEFESLKKEHEELSNQLKAVAIERHPSFRTHFESRTTAAVEKAKASIGPDVTDKAVKLAQLPPSEYRTEQLDKMLTELQDTSPSRAAFLADLIRDVNSISYDRESALKKARDDYDFVQRQETLTAEKSKAEAAQVREQLITTALNAAKDMEAFKRGEDAKANEVIGERENFVKAYLNGAVDEKFAPFVPVLAMEATYLKETLLPSLREENAKLLKQIQEMTQSTPRAGETGGKTSVPQGTPGKRFMEKYLENKPPA